MSRTNTQERVAAVVRALPHVFVFTPHVNYQKFASHSNREITLKAWKRTGEQMQHAYRSGEAALEHVRRAG